MGYIYKHLCLFLVILILSCAKSQRKNETDFSLSIIHLSDFHSRYLQVSLPSGGLCYNKTQCVGGIARVATAVRKLKQIRPNALFLNAGDNFQGSLYYDLFRGNITASFMNELPHDAMTIGNHDFDDGILGLVSYIKQLNSPVVLANIDATNEPLMQNLVKNSTIIEKGDKKIGIIGVITPETQQMSGRTGKLKFLDEVKSINQEAQKLKAQGVNIIIVLSHCGIDRDKIIARKCPDVHVIVGGHSHILLHNGKPPSNEIAYGPYPLIVRQPLTKKVVLIVHAGAFTKYLGNILIKFNDTDHIVAWRGDSIYLDQSFEEDNSTLRNLQPWKAEVDKVGKRMFGETLVYLNGSCTYGECNFANFITDAMVATYRHNASIGLHVANSIQNSIPVGPIFYEDLYTALPYNNTWDLVELQGIDLFKVLEENVAVSRGRAKYFYNPKLLQWSGMRVTYNLTSSASKVVKVTIRSLKRRNVYENLRFDKWYRIVLPDYLLSSEFGTISQKHRKVATGTTRDMENLINYVKMVKKVNITTESRMVFV